MQNIYVNPLTNLPTWLPSFWCKFVFRVGTDFRPVALLPKKEGEKNEKALAFNFEKYMSERKHGNNQRGLKVSYWINWSFCPCCIECLPTHCAVLASPFLHCKYCAVKKNKNLTLKINSLWGIWPCSYNCLKGTTGHWCKDNVEAWMLAMIL